MQFSPTTNEDGVSDLGGFDRGVRSSLRVLGNKLIYYYYCYYYYYCINANHPLRQWWDLADNGLPRCYGTVFAAVCYFRTKGVPTMKAFAENASDSYQSGRSANITWLRCKHSPDFQNKIRCCYLFTEICN